MGPEVPRSELMRRVAPALQRRCVFAGGDDYELLFTAPVSHRAAVKAAAEKCCVAVTLIGSVTYDRLVEVTGEPDFDATLSGYDHFAGVSDP